MSASEVPQMELIPVAVEDAVDDAIEEAGAEMVDVSTKKPMAEILEDLNKPVPPRLLKSKSLGGSKITFVPWYRAQKILDFYTGGWWEYRVVDKTLTDNSILVTVEITIHGTDGSISRQGAGIESLSVSGFGDPSSNALSMAFRRCCAHFGLGLHLYEGEG